MNNQVHRVLQRRMTKKKERAMTRKKESHPKTYMLIASKPNKKSLTTRLGTVTALIIMSLKMRLIILI